MTERLYYADPYCASFSARILERLQWSGHPAVVLDRTAFYPTGGGQPHDTGQIDGVPVLQVVEREDDGKVLHLLAAPLEVDAATGQIDWNRRFDLMQQHSGQHILSAAFVAQLGANTVGFHLSDEYATIDLDRAPLSAQDLAGAEALANMIVFDDRRITSRFVREKEIPSLPLRKQVAHAGPVRVVEIPGFDFSACGGTHLRATGEVGLIKITRSERRGAETRLEFLCGGRALADYRFKNATVMELAQAFTVGYKEVGDAVHRLADELKATRRELRHTRDALLDAEATALWHQAGLLGPVRVVRTQLPGRTADDLKHLALRLAAQPNTAALLATTGQSGEKSHIVFSRSNDLEADMGALVHRACALIGGQGGGRASFAQGGGPQGERVPIALEQAYQTLAESLARREG